MPTKIDNALQQVDMTYQELVVIANDISSSVTGGIDGVIQEASLNLENLSNDSIRDLILKLAMASYTFGDTKEKAAFKAALAKTIKEEARARNVQAAEGTVAAKDSIATLAISAEILTEQLYALVSALLKTKADEIHRVVDALKTVLMTRLTEAKLTGIEE